MRTIIELNGKKNQQESSKRKIQERGNGQNDSRSKESFRGGSIGRNQLVDGRGDA